jgi:hypothetical protein
MNCAAGVLMLTVAVERWRSVNCPVTFLLSGRLFGSVGFVSFIMMQLLLAAGAYLAHMMLRPSIVQSIVSP